ncbi:hypothetical protein HOY80DRAFT_1067642 [Tuber brumale]|nr:hypothetical protein HOY80DRAFT_1067642 [Tuber brumale]
MSKNGAIKGDGKLELPPRGINARFGFTQAEAQKDYFISVCNSLSTISSAKYREMDLVELLEVYTYAPTVLHFKMFNVFQDI